MNIAKPHLAQHRQFFANGGNGGEEFLGFFHGHVEHVGDGFAAEFHIQSFAIIALALAGIAGDIDIGQEVHLNLDDAIALAGFAAPALHIEAEAAWLVAARAGFRQFAEPITDRREKPGIGCRVGTRRAANWRLVNVNDLVEVIEPFDAIMRCRHLRRAHQPPCCGLIERFNHQR